MGRLVVTGCARTGTLYTAALFHHLGIMAGHEAVFNNESTPESIKDHWRKCDGDVSWFAAPFLKNLSDGTVVFHQVRDPLKSLDCFVRHDLLLDDLLKGFVGSRIPECREGTNLERGVWYILRWNEMIENSVDEAQRGGMGWGSWFYGSRTGRLRYLRYRIEKLTPEFLHDALENYTGFVLPLDLVEDALATVSRTTGTCGKHPSETAWADVLETPGGPLLYEQAKRYGYNVEGER